ncbi:MAG: hypothetical protein SCH66_06165 [Methanolobus sp.]|nr:hypothetical protein [Methanolobus sp.]
MFRHFPGQPSRKMLSAKKVNTPLPYVEHIPAREKEAGSTVYNCSRELYIPAKSIASNWCTNEAC